MSLDAFPHLGYYVTVVTIEYLGRKWIQIQGFLLEALFCEPTTSLSLGKYLTFCDRTVGILAGKFHDLNHASFIVCFAFLQVCVLPFLWRLNDVTLDTVLLQLWSQCVSLLRFILDGLLTRSNYSTTYVSLHHNIPDHCLIPELPVLSRRNLSHPIPSHSSRDLRCQRQGWRHHFCFGFQFFVQINWNSWRSME